MANKEENMLKFVTVEENFKECFYLYTKIYLICYQDLGGLFSVSNVNIVFESIS